MEGLKVIDVTGMGSCDRIECFATRIYDNAHDDAKPRKATSVATRSFGLIESCLSDMVEAR